jgi:hypothetical protein
VSIATSHSALTNVTGTTPAFYTASQLFACHQTRLLYAVRPGIEDGNMLGTLPGKIVPDFRKFKLNMNTIHLIGGEKGGVGKSVVARVVAQYLIDKNLPFLGFDTDRSHGSLLRFYADFASPVVVDSYESLDAIVEAAAEQPDKRVLVDLAAQTHDPLVKWMDDSGVLETAEELGVSFSYWHVMDNGKDSVDLLKKLLDRFGARLNYVLVLNQLRGDNFEIFEQSGEREHALALNAQIITLKRLHEPVINKIDAGSTSFWAAKNRSVTDAKGLGLLERQRVKLWLRAAYEQIDTVGI